MAETPPDFLGRIRSALGAPGPLVLLGNFEVEDQWAREQPGLPRLSSAGSRAVVNRMDEFALLLGDAGDTVVLKAAPDPDYLAYLHELELPVPRVLACGSQDAQQTVTEDALADSRLVDELRRLAAGGARLWPHGVSAVEEKLAEATGLPLGAPDARLCIRVNSKIYSRRVGDELGLRQPTGWACETLDELEKVAGPVAELLAAGHRFAVKDALGVSGRGITLVDDVRRFERLCRMILARERRAGCSRADVVVEEWVAKETDLNYQVTVGRDGAVHLDFVKEAITEGGIHKGHRIPARLSRAQAAELAEVAVAVGARLHRDGYFGVAGIDAMIDPDGRLYPLVEINARNNMSTYQVGIQERLIPPDAIALARHYPLRLRQPVAFHRLRSVLGELQFERRSGVGFLVNNFATVNAAAPAPGDGRDGAAHPTFDGRLYGMVVGRSADEVAELDRRVGERVAELVGGAA